MSKKIKSLHDLKALRDHVFATDGVIRHFRLSPAKEAELLIVEGFCNQVIQSFALETSRKELIDHLMDRLTV